MNYKGYWLGKKRPNMAGDKHPRWKGGKPKCLDCGKLLDEYKRVRCRKCNDKFTKGKNHHQYNKIKYMCKNCEKEFYCHPSDFKKGIRQFCSKECKSKYSREWLVCNQCGKIFSSHKFAQRRFCSRECADKWKVNIRGERHPSWKGGKSFEPYPPEFNKSLKELIRNRDGRKCRECGCPEIENGKKLDVHHIDFDKFNNKHINLISLCDGCHRKTFGNREYWIRYYQKIAGEVKSVSFT